MLHEAAATIAAAATHLFEHLGDALTGGTGAIILSAAVRALPKPELMGNKLYQWFYAFTQNLFANPDKARAAVAYRNSE